MQTYPTQTCRDVLAGLRSIGYNDALLQEDYAFPDWFSPLAEERRTAAAAFGQTPVSYDSACIGVVYANGQREQSLVNDYRALGAPIVLEIADNEIREWLVSRKRDGHGLVERYPVTQIAQMFATRAQDWRPQALLRAKNIGAFHWTEQLGLFTGLLPELEDHVQAKLDPLLRQTLSTTRDEYRSSTGHDPDPAQLFKLVFWILTAKVFYDRRVQGFSSLNDDPDEILPAVARHYNVPSPVLLNGAARDAASGIWSALDFRNLSVEVLSHIWSTTLVDEQTKRHLSIHRTPRAIVRYIVERLPFMAAGDEQRIILEPCSGSAVFLVGAMNKLREQLFGATPRERHAYFVRHLAAIEKDPFAVEISRLALTLADFPNADGWNIAHDDVFKPRAMTSHLQRAAIVLCNPPFGNFTQLERARYQVSAVSKPAELLHRVLNDLHPDGVIGFVLPRTFVDGQSYAAARERLTKRFATIDLTVLPDRAFEGADAEIALLIASDPIPHKACRVINRKVNDDAQAWQQFELSHSISSEYAADFGVEQATRALTVPELPEVWALLINYPTLADVADIHRGIEWNRPLTDGGTETGIRASLVREKPARGYRLGVAPRSNFNAFERPAFKYLSFKQTDQRGNAWKNPWDKPKAIVNKTARSRHAWRMAAFPDSEGVVAYQTFIAVWPRHPDFDEFTLAAVLNSPVANAFVATREGKTDITIETLRLLPVPHFTYGQVRKLRDLIDRYISAAPLKDRELLLKEIDAVVLSGYRLPPRVERQLLDFFRGHFRPASHRFGEYVPADCEVYFSLSDFLSPDFSAATAGELLKRLGQG